MNDQRYETYAAGAARIYRRARSTSIAASSRLRPCRRQYRDRLRAVRARVLAVLEQLGAGLVSTAAPGRSARCIPPLAEPANAAADLAARRPRCAGCRYRADDRHSIEQSIPGLAVFSSGFGASVTTTRRCTLHDTLRVARRRLQSVRAKARAFAPMFVPAACAHAHGGPARHDRPRATTCCNLQLQESDASLASNAHVAGTYIPARPTLAT